MSFSAFEVSSRVGCRLQGGILIQLAVPEIIVYLYVCVYVQMLSRVWLFVTLWTVAHQAPLSMEFSRQEYGSWLPFPPPGDLPDPGIKLASLASPTLAGGFFAPPGKPQSSTYVKWLLSHVQLFATPWAYHAPPSMGFSRQEYWSGLLPLWLSW